ncbi:MAG: glycoside hydrolase family protein [Marinimicrobia bacterium 46_43]|nr:MAG: glycoside hydrolase family protein [Marinimicrobia bacterium 46_43]
MASDSIARKAFVENLTRFCLENGYNGADIDWEYPPPDKEKYTTLLFQELYDSFASQNPPLLLSIAAPSTDANNRYNWPVMNQILDWVGVMTYDYYGSWTNKAGPNAPLYGSISTTDQGWIDRSVKHYLNDKGVPPEKLCIGIPFYGWEFQASSLFGTSTGGTQRRYYEIEPLLKEGWIRHWDEETKTPWLRHPNQTHIISFDDQESITEKCSYILNHGLAGTIIWAIGQDQIDGKTPLLTVVGTELESFIQTIQTPGIPMTTELYPNYPNPFNAETRIRFSVQKHTVVKILIYNIQGDLVKTLVDDVFSPGIYRVTFQGTGHPSGIYFCRMETDYAMYTLKMLFMK